MQTCDNNSHHCISYRTRSLHFFFLYIIYAASFEFRKHIIMKLIFKVRYVDFFPTHYTTYLRVVNAFFTVRTTNPTIVQRFSTINNRWCLARSQLAYIICILCRNRLRRRHLLSVRSTRLKRKKEKSQT